MKLTSKLPYEILIKIYEYNPEHREKMKWVIEDINNMQYCDFCGKVIKKYIYSRRRCDMICCSSECVNSM